MTDAPGNKLQYSQYQSLGLVSNPFAYGNEAAGRAGIALDMVAAANRLRCSIVTAIDEERPRPICVIKRQPFPSFYPLRTISMVESTLVNDPSVGALHAYIQLYMMRSGRVRATLRIIGERLAFKDFPKTLAAHIEQIFEEPDESLASYQVLGPERFAALSERFFEDPLAMVEDAFGAPEFERQPELSQVADLRSTELEPDVDESEDAPEIDNTVGNAMGTGLHEADVVDESEELSLFVDYVCEHAKVHRSPVIARAIRVYHDRGLAALPTEFRITKAPRKTLAAIVKYARIRFKKVVIIYDGFDTWHGVPADLRTAIASSLSEIRWMLADDAIMVFLLEDTEVPELEEQFCSGSPIRWDFEGVTALEKSPDTIDRELLANWITSATLPGAEPLSLDGPVLSALLGQAGDSLAAFARMAEAAVDSSAERGVGVLDDESLQAGLAAIQEA